MKVSQYTLTHDQLRYLYDNSSPKVQRHIAGWVSNFNIFPYEKRVWYIDESEKLNTPRLIRFNGEFDNDGDPCGYGVIGKTWHKASSTGFAMLKPRKATEEEVGTLLSVVAIKKGYTKGTVCRNHQGDWACANTDFVVLFNDRDPDGIYIDDGGGGTWVMMNGEWAEILEDQTVTVTLQQISEKFNIPLDKLKIKD